MKPSRLYLILALVVSGWGVLFAALETFWPEWRLVHLPAHAIVETLGGLAAIVMAGFLFQRKREPYGGKLFLLAVGLLGMGLLDIFHAATVPGKGFVLLHCLAGLAGGFWFALTWLPGCAADKDAAWKKWIPWGGVLGSVLVAIWTLAARETLPTMTRDGQFTATAIVSAVVAGVLFWAAAARLLMDFHRSRTLEVFLFACMAALFGQASLMFPFSELWDPTWWLWHSARLAAYLLALALVVREYLHTFSSLQGMLAERQRAEEEAHRLNAELEQRVRDRTAQLEAANRALQASSTYARSLIEASLDPLVTISAEGKITDVNEASVQATGVPREQLIGRDFSDYFIEPDRAREGYRRVFAEGFVRHYPLALRHVSGRVTDVLYNASVYRDEKGNVLGVFAAARDITERKRAEELLARANEELERRVQERTAELQQASDALRASEEQLRLMVQSVKDYAIIMLDPEGRVVNWNAGAERIKGYQPAEIIGRHFSCFYTPEDVQGGRPGHELKLAAVESRFEDEHWRVRKDGSRFWASVILTALRDDAGQLRGFAKITRDITERRRAEEALREEKTRYRTLFEQSPDGVLIIDTQTALPIAFNEIAARQLGYSREEFARLRVNDYEAVERPEVTKARIEKILREGRDDFETQHRTKTNELRDVLVTVQTIEVSGRPVLHCIFRDITERKAAEDQLKRSLADLERSNKELEQFAYVASHDLQEPLRMVSSYTHLLAQRYEGQLDAKAKKFINYAVDGAIRMQALINDLLAYSRIGTRGQPLEPTDSHAVLGEAIRNLAATIEENRAIITNDNLPTVRADASQLVLVFQNLLANAIKFRRDDLPRIHVSAQDRGREWVFAVKDNGIGIEPQHAERVFVIFQRLHTRQEKPGTGIGLAVCKRIVERHGGKLWFESEPGNGTTFFFTVPK